MLGKSARITVEDDRLCSNFHNIVNCPEAACHINELNIRLALGCGIAKRAYPHSIELIDVLAVCNYCLLGNKACNSAVDLNSLNNRYHLKELLKSSSSELRHSKFLRHLTVDLLDLLVKCIGNLYKFSAVFGKKSQDVLLDNCHSRRTPVIAVNDIIRAKLLNDLIVHDVVLNYNIINARNGLDHLDLLFNSLLRESVVSDHLGITKDTNCNRTKLFSLVDDV